MVFCAVVSVFFSVTVFYHEHFSLLVGVATVALLFILIARRSKPGIIAATLVILLAEVTILVAADGIHKLDAFEGKACDGNFIVCENPVERGEYNTVVFECVESPTLKKGTKIFVFYSDKKLRMSDCVSAKLQLHSLQDSKYKAMNYSERVYLSGNLKTAKVLMDEHDITLSVISRIQRYVSNTFFSNTPEKEAAVLTALVAGDGSYMPGEYNELLRAAGVSHAMVVSGMHLSIVMSFVLALLQRVYYNRYIKALIAFCVTVFIMAVCGFGMSIIRAGITYFLVAAALLIGRDVDMVNLLSGAVVIVLLFDPFAALNVAFQLSVLSTLGILVAPVPGELLLARFRIKSKIAAAVISSVCSTLCALLLTLPVCIYYFGMLSTVAVFANLLISAAITVTLVVSIFALLIHLVSPPISKPFFFVTEWLIKYINSVVAFFGKLPHSSIQVTKTALLPLVAFTLALLQIGQMGGWQQKNKNHRRWKNGAYKRRTTAAGNQNGRARAGLFNFWGRRLFKKELCGANIEENRRRG